MPLPLQYASGRAYVTEDSQFPPIGPGNRVYPAEKYSYYARNLCGNNNAEARC